MSDVLQAHLEALEAQAHLLVAQIAACRQLAGPPMTSLPPTCDGVPPDRCARRTPSAVRDMGGLGGGPVVWVCRGCGERMP